MSDDPFAKYTAKSDDPFAKYAAADAPPAPPGVMIHEAGGVSRYPGGVSATIPQDDPQAAQTALEALKQRQEGRNLGEFGRGVAPVFQGLSANFGDEAVSAATAALRAAKGGKFGQEYNLAQEIQRQELEREKASHPIRSTVGEIGGALATLPISAEVAPLRGAGIAPRVGNAAATGAAYGGLYGVGSGSGLQDRAMQGGLGVGIGAVGGAAAVPVVEGAGAVLRGLSYPFQGAVKPELEAQRQLIAGVEAGSGKGSAPAVADQMERAQNGGVPLVTADMGGEYTRGMADQASIKSVKARDALKEQTLDPRFEQQNERINGVLKNMGVPDSVETREALKQQARAANGPAYEAAYNAGDREVWNKELEHVSSAPHVQSAIAQAISDWKNWAVRDGFGAMNPSFRVENGGLIKTDSGLKAYPNIQLWDYAARNLQDAARDAKPGSQQALLYNDLAMMLKNAVDKEVPEYKAAREGAAKFFGADNALTAGEEFLGHQMENTQAKSLVAKMSDPERKLFAMGFASNLIKKVNEVPERADVTKRAIFSSPAAKERIEIALGPEAAKKLEAHLLLEGMMEKTRQAVTGNSKTAQRLVDAGLVGGGIGIDATTGDPLNVPGASMIAGALLKTGRREISARVATHLGRMLASGDADQLRKAVEIVSSTPRLLDSVRGAYGIIPRGVNGVSPTQAIAGNGNQQEPAR